MIFTPQKYAIEDRPNQPFIDPVEINSLLESTQNSYLETIRQVIAHSMNRQRLSMEQVALLLNAQGSAREIVMEAARELKQQIYGNRIVLFAPLYIGNRCINRCSYCSFRADNKETERKTLTPYEIDAEVRALEAQGHKRLILVYGEHPIYDAHYIAETVRATYAVNEGASGEIRRVNINAAPFSVEDFAVIKEAGIGTFQIFQETYNPELYARYHLGGPKANFNWRLTALDRAMEAGIDDVGLGALLGLGDWQYEIMALVRHTNHLEACFGVGPHTISFPRITQALGATAAEKPVSDDDFIYAIAVLRLAVPYTGLILTARENADLRSRAIEYGISQIDGGTKIEIGSYSSQDQEGSGQFTINDSRSLNEIINRLVDTQMLPSFCTACYRKGRTGEHFMEFSTQGFIKRFCTPNAILTMSEYLEDYATHDPSLKAKGYALIYSELSALNDTEQTKLKERLAAIQGGQRDLLF